MTIALDDFEALTRKVERAKARAAEIRGRIAGARDRLKKEYDCRNTQEAKQLRPKLIDREQDLADEYFPTKKKFEAQFGKLLGEDNA